MAKTEIAKKPGGGTSGNQNSAVHGLYSHDAGALKLRARSVRRLVAKAYELCPWLTATDRPVIASWAEVVKLKSICYTALEKSGVYSEMDGDLIPKRLLNEYRMLSQLELSYAKELGLTPASRISLGVDLARGLDLAAQMAAPRNGGTDG